MLKNLKKIRAFTLAEVLITLGIIGVVAQMTIPTLMNSYQKQIYLTGFKKAYSTANQALQLMAADNNCPGDLKCTGFFDVDNTTFGDQFVKYFKIAKNCKDYDVTNTLGCYADRITTNYDGRNISGTDISNGWDAWGYRFTTIDGMSWKVYISGGCEDIGYSNNVTNHLTQMCGNLSVDLNGLNGPNYIGKDIFEFFITNGRGPSLYPLGGVDDKTDGSWKTAGGSPQFCYSGMPNGYLCSGRIIEEGWQINYY